MLFIKSWNVVYCPSLQFLLEMLNLGRVSQTLWKIIPSIASSEAETLHCKGEVSHWYVDVTSDVVILENLKQVFWFLGCSNLVHSQH